MKIRVSPKLFILTTEGYVALEKIKEDPSAFLIKSLVLQVTSEGPSITSIQYGYINIIEEPNPGKVYGIRIFNLCLPFKPLTDDVVVLNPERGTFVDANHLLQRGGQYLTYIKHFVVDIHIKKSCYSTVKPYILNVTDLPSITLSADENGTATLTLFNKKAVCSEE